MANEPQSGTARFTGECGQLQNSESRPVSNLCHGKERHIHADEGFDHCGVDLVLIRTALGGTDLASFTQPLKSNVRSCPHLANEMSQAGNTFEATAGHIDDLLLAGETVHFHIDNSSKSKPP